MSVEVTRLPTGLTVVTDSMPHLQTATMGVWVGSGSRDEEPNEHGISHLLEHMAFKGTGRRTASWPRRTVSRSMQVARLVPCVSAAASISACGSARDSVQLARRRTVSIPTSSSCHSARRSSS